MTVKETLSDPWRFCRCNFKLKLNLEQSLSLVKLATFLRKIFSSHLKERMHIEKSLPIFAEQLDSKLWKTTCYFQSVYVILALVKLEIWISLYELVQSSIGSKASACKTPPKQSINTSKGLFVSILPKLLTSHYS